MDQELKQRLIGAAVVTALAAIFIPMLFDDPVDNSGQIVSELAIPQTPVAAVEDTANKLPSSAAEVTGTPDTGLPPADTRNPDLEPPLQPSDVSDQAETKAEEAVVEPVDEQQWIEESGAEEEPVPVVEDVGDDRPETQANKPSADAGASKPTATPIPKQVSPAKSAKTTVIEEPKKTVKKPLPVTKAESSKAEPGLVRWYIQAGSFGKKENALSRLEALRKQGFPVFLETQASDKGPLYRLKVGPELDKKRATDIRDRFNKQNIKTIIVAE